MEAGGDCCGDFFYVFVNGGYCVGLVSTLKLVEFLHHFFLLHIPVAFIETLCGPDWVVPDVCSNM